MTDCSSAPHLADVCHTSFEIDVDKNCTAYTCTKSGMWGEWGQWSDVVRCGLSNRSRSRECEYDYRTHSSWKASTCNASCWQCIEDYPNTKMCFHPTCMRNCQLGNNTSPHPEFDLTLRCKENGEWKSGWSLEKTEVACGAGETWSSWTECGITCGNQWGKSYRSQTCEMSDIEQASDICRNVLYLQVQPKWCFGKGKCPEVKIVPTLIPEEQKAENKPAIEAEQAVAVGSGIGIAAIGMVVLIFVLDFPSLVLEVSARLVTNIKQACCRRKEDELILD